MVQKESPNKTINKWCEKFGSYLKPKKEQLEIYSSSLATAPTPKNKKDARSNTVGDSDDEHGRLDTKTTPSMKRYLKRGSISRKSDPYRDLAMLPYDPESSKRHRKTSELLAGRSDWQITPKEFESGAEKRLSSVQAKLYQELWNMQTQGLTSE